MPTSFLVDKQGRLSVVYKGKVSVDQLLKDAARDSTSLRRRWIDAACFDGCRQAASPEALAAFDSHLLCLDHACAAECAALLD